jgi:crotonobetainyl-CoA:carnitine CoA-transferase CaiB-like acyl-CoA transferase
VTTDEQWAAFVDALGRPAWASTERYGNPEGRFAHREELDRLVTEWTLQHGQLEVTELLQGAGVAAMPSYAAPELFADPHVIDHGMVVKVPGPTGESLLVRLGGTFSATPMRVDRTGPAMGEHNDEIFRTLLGLSQSQIDDLASEGVFT